MIRITATVFVATGDSEGNVHWSAELAGQTLLARAVETLERTSIVDEVFVVTNDPELAKISEYAGAAVKRLPEWFFLYKLPLLSKEQWILGRAIAALIEQGCYGDVHLILDWRNPMITSLTLERMYHVLMEDRVASRTVAKYAADPNLHMQLPGSSRLFPVWADTCQDRQKVPQLYRTLETGVIHSRRISQPIPETRGVDVGLRQGLTVRTEDNLELAAFYLRHSE